MFSNLRRPDNRATKKTGMKRVRIKGIGKEGRNRGVSPAGTSFIFEKGRYLPVQWIYCNIISE
jgi:hypothetical protein